MAGAVVYTARAHYADTAAHPTDGSDEEDDEDADDMAAHLRNVNLGTSLKRRRVMQQQQTRAVWTGYANSWCLQMKWTWRNYGTC